jgi:predicted PurR-regulated permease PerM
MKTKRIEISYKTIVFTVLFLISLFVIWQIRNLILLIFISFVFMNALNPAVSRLEKLKIPRALSIIIWYLAIISVISFVIAGIVPILTEQTTGLVNSLPNIIKNIKIFGTNPVDFSSQFNFLQNVPENIARTAIDIVSNIFSVFVIFFLTFYLLMEKKNFPKYGKDFFGDKGQEVFLTIIDRIQLRLGSWVNAELVLMIAIGLLSYIGYMILGLKYAVPLAIFAGLLEAVPTIGPTIATLLAGLVGLTVSPLTALLAVGWGIAVQQIENNFIVPKVMKSTVGLNPLVTIIIIAIGAKLAGIVGAILAIPLFLTAEVVFQVLIRKNKIS